MVLPPVLPFACLYPDQKDGLLRQLGSARSESVADNLSLTSFQNDWFSTIAAHDPSLSVHNSWLELGQHILLSDLTSRCKALIEHYPIMRSNFMCFQEEWWQVVLRPDDFEMPLRTVKLRGDFEAECKTVCERDTELLTADQCPTGSSLALYELGRI
jgi:hypothetical protein